MTQDAVALSLCIVVLAGLTVTSACQGKPKERPFLTKPPLHVLTTEDPDRLYEARRTDRVQGFAAGAEDLVPGL